MNNLIMDKETDCADKQFPDIGIIYENTNYTLSGECELYIHCTILIFLVDMFLLTLYHLLRKLHLNNGLFAKKKRRSLLVVCLCLYH